LFAAPWLTQHRIALYEAAGIVVPCGMRPVETDRLMAWALPEICA